MNSCKYKIIFLAGTVLSAFISQPGKLSAQETALSGDRPAFTMNAATIPFGGMQLEGGYTFDRRAGTSEYSLGELLFRAGIHDAIEFRVAVNSLVWQKYDGETRFGKDELGTGMKFRLLRSPGKFNFLHPDLSFTAETTIPVGSNHLIENRFQPSGRLILAWPVSDWFSIGSNVNFSYLNEGGRWYPQASGSLSLGFSLSEDTGCYAEYYAFGPESRKGSSAHYLDGGLTYRVTERLRVDARAGIKPHGEREYFAGMGLILLWPSLFIKNDHHEDTTEESINGDRENP